MRKRPIEVKIISLIYLMMPLFYYCQVVFFEKISLYPVGKVLSFYKAEDILLSIASIVVGIAIYRVRTWGWYLFLFHAIGIVIWNGYVEYSRDVHPNFELMLFSFVTLGVVGIFLRKHIKSPYFNPTMRWWEQERRHAITFGVELFEQEDSSPIAGKTFDVSASGIFFDGKIDTSLGKKFMVMFPDENKLKELKLIGEVVWVTGEKKTHPAGAGIRFINMPWASRRSMRKELLNIEKERNIPPKERNA